MQAKFNNIPNELKDKFKSLLQEFNLMPAAVTPAPVVTPNPAPAVFGEGQLEDGSKVKWEGDMLAVGVPVLVVDPANPEGYLPIPDGEYKMVDGTSFKTEAGKVTELTPVEVVAPVVPPAPEMQVAMTKVEAELKEVKENFSKVNQEKSELAKQIETANANTETLRKQVAEIFSLVGQMIDLPSETPIQTPASNPSNLTKKEKLLQKFTIKN